MYPFAFFSMIQRLIRLSGCLLFVGGLSAQTVFNALVPGPNGPVHGLFQEQNGTVTPINTGLSTNQFPSLSRDGRFITIAAPDPAQPNQVATDLFLYDRLTGTRSRLVNYTAEQQPDGSFVTPHALFSALSPNNELIALHTMLMVTTNLQGMNSTPMLTLHRASDGFQLYQLEMGLGNTVDFFRAEYVGLSWSPNGLLATPAYVPTVTATGQTQVAVGIVLFGFNANTNLWERVGQLTQPRIFDNVVPAVIETHILPSFSPDGQRLAFFEVTYADPMLQSPASARLIVVNANGSNPLVLVNFNPGFFPLGLTWSADGNDVIYSIGPQSQVPGAGFAPSAEPDGAVVRSVNSFNPVFINRLPGIDAGFFPLRPMVVTDPGGPDPNPTQPQTPEPEDLSGVSLSLEPQSNGDLLLRAPGLNPSSTYRVERSNNLVDFEEEARFSGQQIMSGIAVPATTTRFFRLRHLP